MAKATIDLTNGVTITIEGQNQDVFDTLKKIKDTFDSNSDKSKCYYQHSLTKTDFYNTLVEIDDGDNGSMYVYVTPEEYNRITY